MERLGEDVPLRMPAEVEETRRRIQDLFPQVLRDGQIDLEVLGQLIGLPVERSDEKFGLNWHGKSRARQLALTPSTGTLRPAPEDSVDWNKTQHLMIEGDNLEVLKLLQKSYSGRVKLIYIDPPYNTGKDFVYRDDFKHGIRTYLEMTRQSEDGAATSTNPETSGRFHTDWLNMMYPRLMLARQLLRSDGYLVASIDDGEVGNLRSLLDEVFGEENFIANVVWQKKYTRANDATFFSSNHDHLLVVAKNRDSARMGRVPRGEEQLAAYKNPDNHPKGPWKATPLHARSGTSTSPYVFRNGREWEPPPGTYRRFSDDTMHALEEEDAIWFGSDGNQTPSRKSFLQDMDDGMVPVTIWDYEFAGHNHQANEELKKLGLGGTFTSPKPSKLIRRLCQLMAGGVDDIIMDFFAGSGTTGHAVMAQNAEDGGRRPFIMVQLPEPLDREDKSEKLAAEFCDKLGKPRNIAELTKERLRRAADKIREEHPDYEGDLGFRVFKLDSSNIRAWDPQPEHLEETLLEHVDHLKEDRSEQDVLYELLLKLGLDLCVPIETNTIVDKTVHSIGAGTLFACLDETLEANKAEDLALGIVEWRDKLDPAGDTTVVFRDSAFPDDVTKTNVDAILKQHNITTVRSI